MEDLTMVPRKFDLLLSDIAKKIQEGESEENIVEALEKSVFDARLKSTSEPTYFIMSINMNGPRRGKGTADKRRILLSVILRCFPAAIIFCQELPGKFGEVIKSDHEQHKFVTNEDEAAVVWETETFDGSDQGLKPTDRQIIRIRDSRTQGTQGTQGTTELLSRIVMVKLTPKEKPTQSILAVSYHGPHRGLNKQKKDNNFKGLLEFVRKVIQEYKIGSYIIGGDFNLDTLNVDLPNNVVVPFYELSPRSQAQKEKATTYIPRKDNFIFYPHQDVKVSWLRSFQFEDDGTTYSDKFTDATAKGAESPPTSMDRLDHDPVVGLLVLSSFDKVMKNLSKDFNKVSTSDESKGTE